MSQRTSTGPCPILANRRFILNARHDTYGSYKSCAIVYDAVRVSGGRETTVLTDSGGVTAAGSDYSLYTMSSRRVYVWVGAYPTVQ